MKKKLVILSAIVLLVAAAPDLALARSAVFGGGPFYTGGTSAMNTLRSSGFTTVILWTIHVHSNGNLVYNDTLIVSNGAYVGRSTWPSELATLRQAPTSVSRIEVGVGSWGVNDFATVRDLMNAQGTGSSSILYRNFLALKNATGANAINFDDETLYDTATSVRFGVMLADLGYKVALCPYTNPSHWSAVRSQINSQRAGAVDRVYLQAYAGGASNNPSSWNTSMGTVVDPGLWCRHGSGCTAGDNPSSVQSKMSGWRSTAGIVGGFMWLYDDMLACSSQGTPAQYAAAINNGVGGGTATPTPTAPPSGGISSTAWYSAVNRNSGKCVDARGSGTANGTAVQQYTCNNTYAQHWQFQPTSGGYYRVNTRNATGQSWDVSGVSTADGAKVHLWSYGGGNNQQWLPQSLGGGYYRFVARHSGKCLDVPGSSTAESLQLQQYTCNNTNAQSFFLQLR